MLAQSGRLGMSQVNQLIFIAYPMQGESFPFAIIGCHEEFVEKLKSGSQLTSPYHKTLKIVSLLS